MIQATTRKTLWTRALNQCAYPGCLQALTVDIKDAKGGSPFALKRRKMFQLSLHRQQIDQKGNHNA